MAPTVDSGGQGDPHDKTSGSAEEKRRNHSMENQLYSMYVVVAACVAGAWLLGALGFSSLWIFVLAAILFTMWRTRVAHMVRQQLYIAEVKLQRKRALRNSETAEWLNFIINRWWVFSSSTIQDMVKRKLDTRLEDVKPGFLDHIELSSFTVGEQTPCIRSIKVFEYEDGLPGGTKPVSWLTVTQPPYGLHKMAAFQVVIETELSMHSEDFKMVFRSRLGSKRLGFYVDTAVENLNISGKLQIILHLSMDVAFPHITKATIAFVDAPEVWFNVRTLKALQMMELPLLRSWIHTHVMEGLATALVDPGKIDLKISTPGPIYAPRMTEAKPLAEGVLTVTLRGKPASDSQSDDIHYCVLKIDDAKRNTHEVMASEEWEDGCSFLIYDLAKTKLCVKRKCKRLLTSTTLELHDVILSKFPFQVRKNVTTTLKGKDNSELTLAMQYTSLSPVSLDVTQTGKGRKAGNDQTIVDTSGVLYVCIHGATNVLAGDRGGTSDPYCVLFADRRRVMTTPYIVRNRNPIWESPVEFFVGNFTKLTLSLLVYDWDGASMIDDDFLGSTHINMSKEEPVVIRQVLTLGYNRPSEGHVQNKEFGCLTVSAVFRPVASVAKSERFRAMYDGLSPEMMHKEDTLPPLTMGLTPAVPEGNKSGRRRKISILEEQLLEDKAFVELTIVQAKELIAADRNGFSDPYVEVTLGEKRLFRSSVRKKTLSPVWEENVTFQMPREEEILEVSVFDKDIFGNDFLGKMLLTVDQLKELSHKGTAEWYQLQRAKSGSLRLMCSVIERTAKPAPLNDTDINSNNPNHVINQNQQPSPLTIHEAPSQLPNEANHKVTEADTLTNLSSSPLKSPARSSISGDSSIYSPPSSANQSPIHRIPEYAEAEDCVFHASDPSPSTKRRYMSFGGYESGGSVASSIYSVDKVYNVKGEVTQITGLTEFTEESCVRVKFERQRGSKSFSKLLTKSRMMKPAVVTQLNMPFEVNHGAGVSKESYLVLDIKGASKEHLASKGFTFNNLLADCPLGQSTKKWLAVHSGVDIEIRITHSIPDHRRARNSTHNVFRSLSFRKKHKVTG